MKEEECWIGEVLDSRQKAPSVSSDEDWIFQALAGAIFLVWILVVFAAVKIFQIWMPSGM